MVHPHAHPQVDLMSLWPRVAFLGLQNAVLFQTEGSVFACTPAVMPYSTAAAGAAPGASGAGGPAGGSSAAWGELLDAIRSGAGSPKASSAAVSAGMCVCVCGGGGGVHCRNGGGACDSGGC